MVISPEIKFYILQYIDTQKKCTLRSLFKYCSEELPPYIKVDIKERTFRDWIELLSRKGTIRIIQKYPNCLIRLKLTNEGKTQVKYLKRTIKMYKEENRYLSFLLSFVREQK